MKRRSFLKYLSSIPLIGIPVKLLANNPNKHVGTKTWSDGSQTRITREEFYADFKDPYEDVEHIPWDYPKIVSAEEMNAHWREGEVRGVRAKWRRVENRNQVINADELETDFGKITLNRGVSWLD